MAGAVAPSVARKDDAAMDAVGIKAFCRLAEAWTLTAEEAAALLDVAPRTYGRIKRAGWSGRLGQDQRLRLSALVGLYKGLHIYFADDLADRWVKRTNSGPLFRGASPLAYMRAGGLPAILETRNYVDALRGGA